jgi:hypothetical protein
MYFIFPEELPSTFKVAFFNSKIPPVSTTRFPITLISAPSDVVKLPPEAMFMFWEFMFNTKNNPVKV